MTRRTLHEATESESERARNGLAAALVAYLLWGLLPIYFKVVQIVPPLEVLTHRTVWAVPFGALIIALRRQWRDVWRAIAEPRTLTFLGGSAVLIGVNWFVFIYAVQQAEVFQASLGYYINPLMNVVVGVIFFHERLRLPQMTAVALAAAGVVVLALSGNQVPWISLALALSFTCYGVIRKQVAVGGMPGLFIETLFLMPIALVYLGWLVSEDAALFLADGAGVSGLLVLAGPFTVVPLLMFALAARRLPLTTIGILQFITPTMQFLVGVAYGETLTTAHVICFGCIWVGITLFVLDAWQQSRRIQALRTAGTQ